jgi:DNA repair protein RadC
LEGFKGGPNCIFYNIIHNVLRGITRKMKAAGTVLEIKVLDHLIVTTEGYFSFADEGIM